MKLSKGMEEVVNWLVEREGWTKEEAMEYIRAHKLESELPSPKAFIFAESFLKKNGKER